MRTFAAIALLLAFAACAKSHQRPDCDLQMIERFKDKTGCTPGMHTSLMKGMYRGQRIYFLQTICMQCFAAIPDPDEGYHCKGDTLLIEDFKNSVSNIEVIKGCEKP